jgi:hypothetical protein
VENLQQLSRRLRWPVLCGVAALVLVVWWWAPSFGGDSERVDTLVVHDGLLGPDQRPVSDRLHEAGRTIEWREADDLCAALSGSVDERIDVIVVASADLTRCGSAIEALRRRSVITVSADGVGATVDTAPLLGGPATVSMPCQWWDSVCDSGAVTVRNDDGSLTNAGLDRVGRLIVAELP